jgi:hypothetical protein
MLPTIFSDGTISSPYKLTAVSINRGRGWRPGNQISDVAVSMPRMASIISTNPAATWGQGRRFPETSGANGTQLAPAPIRLDAGGRLTVPAVPLDGRAKRL